MIAYVVDVETTIRNPVGMGASAYYPDKRLVMVGMRQVGSENVRIVTLDRGALTLSDADSAYLLGMSAYDYADFVEDGHPITLIGHNIGFDLHWLYRYASHSWCNPRRVKIWDTQQAAYLLSGQSDMFPSLDDISNELSLPVKDDKIKQYWADGVDTFDIPDHELRAYLEQDVNNTYIIHEFQQHMMKGLPYLSKLANWKMEDILMTVDMERNGMHFDMSACMHYVLQYEETISLLQLRWEDLLRKNLSIPTTVPLPSISSNKDVSVLLYGGDIEYTTSEWTGEVYKSGIKKGEKKYSKVGRIYSASPQALCPWPKLKVDDEALEYVLNSVETTDDGRNMVQILRAFRLANKELTTYLRGYSQLVLDSRLHPSLNHCSTATGRLSCTTPNLQNVSKNED